MIKQVYVHCLLLIALICYIIAFVLLGIKYDVHEPRFNFLLALAILSLLSLGLDYITTTYFTEAGTIEDVYSRQHNIFVAIYTVSFTVAVSVNNDYCFFIPVIFLFLSTFHRSYTNPEFHLTLADITVFVVWVVFLLHLF